MSHRQAPDVLHSGSLDGVNHEHLGNQTRHLLAHVIGGVIVASWVVVKVVVNKLHGLMM